MTSRPPSSFRKVHGAWDLDNKIESVLNAQGIMSLKKINSALPLPMLAPWGFRTAELHLVIIPPDDGEGSRNASFTARHLLRATVPPVHSANPPRRDTLPASPKPLLDQAHSKGRLVFPVSPRKPLYDAGPARATGYAEGGPMGGRDHTHKCRAAMRLTSRLRRVRRRRRTERNLFGHGGGLLRAGKCAARSATPPETRPSRRSIAESRPSGHSSALGLLLTRSRRRGSTSPLSSYIMLGIAATVYGSGQPAVVKILNCIP
ncbi:hypothetical protein C8Q70DRAFT_585781 [Cubamyces menziesii]|nr:hypothetical protein C8Q70DRAFT_585781 [Cubamyces menziesii]